MSHLPLSPTVCLMRKSPDSIFFPIRSIPSDYPFFTLRIRCIASRWSFPALCAFSPRKPCKESAESLHRKVSRGICGRAPERMFRRWFESSSVLPNICFITHHASQNHLGTGRIDVLGAWRKKQTHFWTIYLIFGIPSGSMISQPMETISLAQTKAEVSTNFRRGRIS